MQKTFRPHFNRSLFALLGAAAVGLSTGCHSHLGQAAVTNGSGLTEPLPIAAMLPVDVAKYRPDETGVIPILEYHDIVATTKVHGYQYPAESLRRDLEYLYNHAYRPINLSDYVHGKIDCPAGMTPVILTFDDALRGQFNYLPDGSIDPNCAVGILDAFHQEHPDWPLKGTFFVLTGRAPHMPPAFYQKATSQKKLQYLVGEGFEIGNHTVHHKMGMKHFSDAQAMSEFAGAVANIQYYLPGYDVDTLALPYGVYPNNQKLVITGESNGVTYHNICAMLAGADPAPSPMDKSFKPYRLPRIIPGQQAMALQYWFTYLEKHKTARFVSDGDPNTFTIPSSKKLKIDVARIKADHLYLRVYSGPKAITVIGPPAAPKIAST